MVRIKKSGVSDVTGKEEEKTGGGEATDLVEISHGCDLLRRRQLGMMTVGI